VAPRVEYSHTELGKTIIPLLEEIARWGWQMGDRYWKMERVG
jgi:DNA-binding HxlR family transcriptional regulator